ncbi:hypothetical protein S101468_03286 (plasmid) [Acetobacter pasteurianus subsp. pasteurianus]|uniref:Uncharacterized protein n=1 Tax=Acetobacter pasteurianus subsp. pasteurianus TaxID=481145 RepID=A0AAC9SVP6_ACEPA|nr:hypothetical protein S101468_03286 [Acetobacter pasteurianus subsp. pasteurianus]
MYDKIAGAVHPRVCGEHVRHQRRMHGPRGSSPRVRGTLNSAYPAAMKNRFIPACAGNTLIERISPTPYKVHPRVCGEHLIFGKVFCMAFGSSPRVRGTRAGFSENSRGDRFIPACAGNTKSHAIPASVTSVHPRVCGEHVGDALNNNKNSGSSPRVRGTPFQLGYSQQIPRFIPACAGNTNWQTR